LQQLFPFFESLTETREPTQSFLDLFGVKQGAREASAVCCTFLLVWAAKRVNAVQVSSSFSSRFNTEAVLCLMS
jgi:hypothetical protein